MRLIVVIRFLVTRFRSYKKIIKRVNYSSKYKAKNKIKKPKITDSADIKFMVLYKFCNRYAAALWSRV